MPEGGRGTYMNPFTKLRMQFTLKVFLLVNAFGIFMNLYMFFVGKVPLYPLRQGLSVAIMCFVFSIPAGIWAFFWIRPPSNGS